MGNAYTSKLLGMAQGRCRACRRRFIGPGDRCPGCRRLLQLQRLAKLRRKR